MPPPTDLPQPDFRNPDTTPELILDEPFQFEETEDLVPRAKEYPVPAERMNPQTLGYGQSRPVAESGKYDRTPEQIAQRPAEHPHLTPEPPPGRCNAPKRSGD